MASPFASGQFPPKSMDASLVAMGDSALGTQMDSFFRQQVDTKPALGRTLEDSFSINDRRDEVQVFKPPTAAQQPQQVPSTMTMVQFWQSQEPTRPDLATASMKPQPQKAKPRAPFSNLSDREKAESYFDLYDRNQRLQKSHYDLEVELKQLTTKLMKIEKDVKVERNLTEGYTGMRVPPAAHAEMQSLQRENSELKTRLSTLTRAVRDGSLKRGKHGLVGPYYPPGQDHPRVLPSSTSENVKAEELVLIEKLRTQVIILEKELQRYRSKPTPTAVPSKVSETLTQTHSQVTDLERSLRTMEEGFLANKRFYEQTKAELEETRVALASEKAKSSDLQIKLRVAVMGTEGANDMARKIDELTRENRNLEAQIKDLCASPFIKEAGDRVMNRSRILTFEQEIKVKSETIAKLTDIGVKLEAEVERLKDELKRVSAERDKNREEYLKAIVRLEEREKQTNPLDAQFSAMKGSADNSEFEKAMRLINLRGEEPVWGRLDFLERARVVPEDVPTLKKEVQRLRLEKSQLIAELEKTQRILTLKNELEKDQHASKLGELEQIRMQLKAAQQRAEELARLADFRANRVIQLEENMRLNVYDDDTRIVASKTEIRLTDLGEGNEFVSGELETEVGSGENIYDLWLGEAEYYPIALREVLGNSDLALVSFLTVDFYNHETQVTNICEGLKPRYNVHISFKVAVDDLFLKFLKEGFAGVEAVALKEQEGHIALGHGRVPLLELVKKAGTGNLSNEYGAVIEGVCTLLSVADGRSTIGVVKYKMRMRHPLSEALRWYHEQEEIVSIGHPLTYLLDKVHKLEEKPSTQTRTLEVRIERCASLTATVQPGLPSQPAPFVSYQLPGQDPIVTATKAGTEPIFAEVKTLEVELTTEFQRFLDMGSLDVLVFDDNVPVQGQDMIGCAKVPLANLLLNMPVEGTYTLYGKDGRPSGVVTLSIIWHDMKGTTDASRSDQIEHEIWLRIANNLKARGLTIESAYNIFDQDQDGLISGQEFRNTLLITLRVQVTEQEIQMLLNLLATSNGAISKTEFRSKLQGLLPLGVRTQETGAWEESILERVRGVIRTKNLSLKAAFDAFDINSSGTIEADEFRRTFQIMQLGLSDEEVGRVFAYFEPGPEGKISYQRFMERMLVDAASKTDAASPQDILKKVGLLIRESKMQLRQAFQVFDQNGDGKISRVEFVKVFDMMRLGLSAAEVEMVWNSLKKDAQGFLNYNDFCAVFEVTAEKAAERPTFPALRQRIVTVLKAKAIKPRALMAGFDRNRDGSLSRQEFREALESLRINLSSYDIEVLVETADRNSDGQISLSEWCDLVEPRDNPIDAFKALVRNSKLTTADVFNAFDQNKDGFVSGQEFRDALLRLNLGLTLTEIDDLIRGMDHDKDGRLNYAEFLKVLQDPGKPSPAPTPTSRQTELTKRPEPQTDVLKEVVTAISQSKIPLRQAFDVFDKNRDGWVSVEEFRAVLDNMQIRLTPPQISQLVQRIDVNRDGKMSYDEFRKLFSAYGLQLAEPLSDPRQPSATSTSSLSRKKIRSPVELYQIIDEYMAAQGLNLQRLYTTVFDQNRDNYISKEELVRGFGRLTPVALTDGEVAALMNDVCPPGQSKLNFSLLESAYNRYKEVTNPHGRRQLLQASESLTGSMKASYSSVKK